MNTRELERHIAAEAGLGREEARAALRGFTEGVASALPGRRIRDGARRGILPGGAPPRPPRPPSPDRPEIVLPPRKRHPFRPRQAAPRRRRRL